MFGVTACFRNVFEPFATILHTGFISSGKFEEIGTLDLILHQMEPTNAATGTVEGHILK